MRGGVADLLPYTAFRMTCKAGIVSWFLGLKCFLSRERVWEQGAQREREREREKSQAGSMQGSIPRP